MRRQHIRRSMGIFGLTTALLSSLLLTSTVAIAANPSATLDQCANGSITNPDNSPCQQTGEWVNGNLGSSKAHYNEGDSVPYRFTFGNLAVGGSHTVTLEWDTTKGGKHALDYITTWNRTVTDSNPCFGVSGCVVGSPTSTGAIPADPQVTGAGVSPVSGVFTMWGGTITNVSGYSYALGSGFAGDKSAKITVTFTSNVANPVLAWGGHIATRLDWGTTSSAVAISGSPYHMRLLDLDGAGGNQDRSLSADAVTFPGSITIIKDAQPNAGQDFAFTATGVTPTTFNLDDDSDPTLQNTQVFSNITTFGSKTFEESAVNGWSVSFNNPICTLTSANGGAGASVAGAKLTIGMAEGENYTCTFVNTPNNGTITLTKVVQSLYGGNAGVNDFSLTIGGTAVQSGGSIAATPGQAYAINETQITGYEFVSITGTGCPTVLGGTVSVGPGGSASCTITNRDIAPTLALNKTVSNTHGGNNVENDFVLSATPTTGSVITDAGGDVPATAGRSNTVYTLSETSVAGYTAGSWSCSGTGVHWAANDSTHVTLDEGATGSCSITNSDVAPTLALVKVVDNSNGGTAVKSDFTLTATPTTGTAISGTADVAATAGVSNMVYTLSESGPAGYLGGDWSCTGTGVVWSAADPSHVTLNEGATGTCTIQNNDVAPTLKLDKTVSNTHGGNAGENDFVLSATPTTGITITDAGGDVGPAAARSGVVYTLSESTLTGYTGGTWSCTGAGSGWSAGDPTHVTLSPGGTVVCSITNSDVAPTLALDKTVSNTHGGNAVESDFILTATPATGSAISGAADVSATAGRSNTVYTLSESALTGYTAGTWSCSGTGVHWTAGDPTHVTLDEGAAGTCGITNSDVAPTLALDKTVANLNGGTATEDSFVLYATPITGAVITDTSGDVPATAGASNSQYTLTESSVPGYTGGNWSCSGTGVHFDPADPTHVTLDEGAVATCSITNTDSKNSPTGNTTMAWVVKDSASYTIRAGAADAGSATIAFKLYSDVSCGTQVGSTHTVGVTISPDGKTATATDTTGYAVAAGTYYWRTFYSGDGFNNAANTACGTEVTTISGN